MVMKYKEQNLYQRIENRKNNVFLYPSLKSILAQLLVPKKTYSFLQLFIEISSQKVSLYLQVFCILITNI